MYSNITYTDKKDTRSGFGAGAYELAKRNPNVVALCADLSGSLKLGDFIKKFPERFFQSGIAEANMIGVAAGLTIGGKIPLATSFANFVTGRVYDQIRQSVAYSGKNVKICASHAGLTLGEDGATHQILEDIGMMRMLPGMNVIVPADYAQTKAATEHLDKIDGPVYLRFGRPSVPIFTQESDFEFGKAQILGEGSDVTIIACGHLVWEAVLAAQELEKDGVSVELINMHTIKPIDQDAIVDSLKKTKCVVTAEEHNILGGLGSAVSEVAGQYCPVPHEFVGVNDSFGESGKPAELLKKYGCNSTAIIQAVRKVLVRK